MLIPYSKVLNFLKIILHLLKTIIPPGDANDFLSFALSSFIYPTSSSFSFLLATVTLYLILYLSLAWLLRKSDIKNITTTTPEASTFNISLIPFDFEGLFCIILQPFILISYRYIKMQKEVRSVPLWMCLGLKCSLFSFTMIMRKGWFTFSFKKKIKNKI